MSSELETLRKELQREQEARELLEKQLRGVREKSYPNGQASPDDQGELALMVTVDEEKQIIRIEFGKEVKWLGMHAEQAVHLAEMLIEKAKTIATEPLVIRMR